MEERRANICDEGARALCGGEQEPHSGVERTSSRTGAERACAFFLDIDLDRVFAVLASRRRLVLRRA